VPVPKSVTKINKDGVTFIDSVDRAEYTLAELSRAALRDAARVLRRIAKENTPVVTGTLKKNIATWVRGRKDYPTPYLQLGVYSQPTAKKKGLTPAYHAHLAEFGSVRSRPANEGRGILRPTVQDNIDLIRRVQAQYLAEVEKEVKAMDLIDEEEEIADD
jgi:HK97 gp10 family phage protein